MASVKKVFLAKDIWGRTPWHMATQKDQTNTWHKLSEWDK